MVHDGVSIFCFLIKSLFPFDIILIYASFKCVLQDTVSVHRPNFYADRFLKFMGSTVFKKIHRKCDASVIIFRFYLRVYFMCLCMYLIFLALALRGASSRRKKNSIRPCRSASQEALSTVKEESLDRKAQSLENLDDPGAYFTNLFFNF